MNRLTLKLFATLRERARTAELDREFPDGTTVGEIWHRLLEDFPALGGHHDGVAFAVNQEYVKEDYRPRNNDEVAFIPPVSGGADAPWVGPISIGRGPVDLEALERAVADPRAGATVTFGGTGATNVAVVNGTTITATTPAGSAGAVTVTVTANGQSGSLTNGFTYVVPPTVTSVSPRLPAKVVTFWCGRFRNDSSKPSSAMTSSVDG